MAQVLIIDDDMMVRRLLEEQLLTQSYDTVSVPTAEEGYMLAVKTPPDLILLDVNLPDATGFQMCGRFRQNPLTHSIPIIMMTGAARWPNQQAIGRQMGANEYILKPFDVMELGKRVDALVNSKGPVRKPSHPAAAPALEVPAPVHPQTDEAPAALPAQPQAGGDQRFSDFSAEVLILAARLPLTLAGRHTADQLLKCGTAVGARIHESQSAESRDDVNRIRGAALKELRETGYWLMLIRKSGLLEAPLVEALEKKCHDLSADLAGQALTSKPIA